MAQKKAFEVQSWINRPDSRFPIVLLYGPDRGLVAERARTFAEKTGVALDDPFSVVRLEAAEADTSGRLIDEARTVSMFAAKRLLWVRNAGAHKALADDIKALAAEPPADTLVLIEAAELKKGAGLRAIVEQSPNAIALPCYGDEARDLDQLIDEVFAASGIRIGLDARTMLRRNLGGDRLATRGELQKLALFGAGKPEITVDDVRDLTGDVSALSLDDAVDAALEGKVREFDTVVQRYMQSGGQTFLLISGMSRQLQTLQPMREALDSGGRSAGDLVATAKPAVFFSRKKVMETALRRFSAAFLQRSLERLHQALLQSRRRPDLAGSITRQALLGIALESERQGNR